jgi:hypothetical protein
MTRVRGLLRYCVGLAFQRQEITFAQSGPHPRAGYRIGSGWVSEGCAGVVSRLRDAGSLQQLLAHAVTAERSMTPNIAL